MKFVRAWYSLCDRNWRAASALRRASGSRLFVCRGSIQLALDSQAHVASPSSKTVIGISLVDSLAARDESTILNVGNQAVLRLDGVTIGRGARLGVLPGAILEIGEGTYLTGGTRVGASQSIQIGRRCAISWGCTIIDDDGHGAGEPPYSSPVVIEDDVWVGCNVTILKGVTIGSGSAVAAGAVVTRSCPPNSLLAGVPARVIRSGYQWRTQAAASELPLEKT